MDGSAPRAAKTGLSGRSRAGGSVVVVVGGVVVVVVVVVVVDTVVVVATAAVVVGASVGAGVADVADVDSESLPPHAAAIRAKDPSMTSALAKRRVLLRLAVGMVPNIAPLLLIDGNVIHRTRRRAGLRRARIRWYRPRNRELERELLLCPVSAIPYVHSHP